MTYHNDLSVPIMSVCPNCGKRGLHTRRQPTGQQVDVDDIKTSGKWCRYCEYVE